MSVTKTRRDTGQNYRVPPHLVEWARHEAKKRCKATGRPVNWSHIVREALQAAATQGE